MKYYVVFVPHRKCDYNGELKENIYFSREDALGSVTEHYRNLYISEIDHYSDRPEEEFIQMGNDETYTIEPDTFEKLQNWIEYDPTTLEDLINFYNEMYEELDFSWRLSPYDDVIDINDVYEIVELKHNKN